MMGDNVYRDGTAYVNVTKVYNEVDTNNACITFFLHSLRFVCGCWPFVLVIVQQMSA